MEKHKREKMIAAAMARVMLVYIVGPRLEDVPGIDARRIAWARALAGTTSYRDATFSETVDRIAACMLCFALEGMDLATIQEEVPEFLAIWQHGEKQMPGWSDWGGVVQVAIAAMDRDEPVAVQNINKRADEEWTQLTGLPALSCLAGWRGAVAAAGYSTQAWRTLNWHDLQEAVGAWAKTQKA